MTYRVVRTSSPPRIQLDGPKVSSATVPSSAYDVRYSAQPQPSFTTLPIVRDPRRNSAFETIPVSKSTYSDATKPGTTVSRTEYSVKPRRESTAAETRRPLSVMTRNVSPAKTKSSAEPARDHTTHSAVKEDKNRFLQPRPRNHHSSHKRHVSATPAELSPKYAYALGSSSSSSRGAREYHKRGPYVVEAPDGKLTSARALESDLQYEYTGPREQFARDYPSHPKRRESASRNERLHASRDLDLGPPPSRQDTTSAVKKPDAYERGERHKTRHSGAGFESDPDRRQEGRKPRAYHDRPVLHQDSGYTSSRAEYDRRRSHVPSSRPEEVMAMVAKGHYRDEGQNGNQGQVPRKQRAYDRDEVIDYEERYDFGSQEPRKYRTENKERDVPLEYEREQRRDRDYDLNIDRERNRHRERAKRVDPDPARELQYDRTGESDRRERTSRPARPERSERKVQSRDSSPENSGVRKAAGAVSAGGLAAAAAAALGTASKSTRGDGDSEYDTDGRHPSRRRSKYGEDDREHDPERERSDRHERRQKGRRHRHKEDNSDSELPREVGRTGPRSNAHDTRSTEATHDQDGRRDPQITLLAASEDEADRRSSIASDTGLNTSGRGSARDSEGVDALIAHDRTVSPDEDDVDRPRKVTLVEPPKPKELVAPKGILKKPRETPFPEDPNPTREGVAPLNNAGKDGIPPGARWTKINRMIVNPEALEKANERFEVREEYVIVLRVLAREEIEKLADSTRKIRGKHGQVVALNKSRSLTCDRIP